jgi:hypothetical protein
VIAVRYRLAVSDHRVPRRVAFILTLWAEDSPGAPRIWRGYLEAATGQRHYFRQLTDLNRLIQETSGWADPANVPPREEIAP